MVTDLPRGSSPRRIAAGALCVAVKPPAWGFSTLLARLVAAGTLPASAVVSLDTLRAQLTGDEADQSANPAVVETAHRLVTTLLSQGRTVVFDQLGLNPAYRAEALALARARHAPAVALLAAPRPLEVLLARDAARTRHVPAARIVELAAAHAGITVAQLYAEGFDDVIVVDDATVLQFIPTGEQLHAVTGPFDVFGDVHGCDATWTDALAACGYDRELNHPDGRLAVSVGDVHDKGGPRAVPGDPARSGSVSALRRAVRARRTGRLIWLLGNHERKLLRWLLGYRKGAHTLADLPERAGLRSTVEDIFAQDDAEALVDLLIAELSGLPVFVVLDGLVVAHAAMRPEFAGTLDPRTRREAERFCVYHRGELDWTGPQALVTGHLNLTEPLVRQQPADGRGASVCIDSSVYAGFGLSVYSSDTGGVRTVPTRPEDVASAETLAALPGPVVLATV